MTAIFIATALSMACVPKPADAPSATLTFAVGADKADEVDTFASEFAAENGFIYGSERMGARIPQEIVIHLVRDDIQIIGRDPFTPGQFRFYFYRTERSNSKTDSDISVMRAEMQSRVMMKNWEIVN